MKINPFNRINPALEHRHVFRPPSLFLALALAAAPVPALRAADDAQPTNQPAAQAPAEKPAPLPLHQIEGSGGIFSTLSAYIVNPPRDGEPVGRPSVGFAYVNLGSDKNLEALDHHRIALQAAGTRLRLGSPRPGRSAAGVAKRRPGQLSRRRGSTAQLQRALPDS